MELNTVMEEGETVAEYAARMQRIFLKQKILEEKTKLGYFTNGLRKEICLEAERTTVDTLDAAISEARKVEKIVDERKKMEEEREKRLTRNYEQKMFVRRRLVLFYAI